MNTIWINDFYVNLKKSQIIFIILINLIFIDTLFSKTHPQIDGLKNIK